MCVCVIFNFGTLRTMFSQKGGVCNGVEFVNNTLSSTTCFKYCVSLDFRPSVMESSSNAVSALHQSLWLAVSSSSWREPVESSLSVHGIKGNCVA